MFFILLIHLGSTDNYSHTELSNNSEKKTFLSKIFDMSEMTYLGGFFTFGGKSEFFLFCMDCP